MNETRCGENSYQSRIWTNTIRLFLFGITWVATCALMGLGPKDLWDKDSVFTLLAVGVNLAAGVGLILAHKRYITGLDELQQRVYLNALAITVGVAVIVGIPWTVLNRYQIISFKADMSNLIAVMSLTYVVSVRYGNWRYR